MKTLRFAGLILRKDIRRQRPFLFLLLSALVITLITGVALNREIGFLSETTWVLDFLLILLAIRVILADPPGQTAVLESAEPAPWIAVPIAKGLFIGLLLILPVVGLRELLAARVGLKMSPHDHGALLIETASEIAVLLGLAVMGSLFTRKIILAFIYFALAEAASYILPDLSNWFWGSKALIPDSENVYLLMQCRELVLDWGLCLVIIATVLVRYRARGLIFPLGVAALGMCLATAASTVWPIDFASPLGGHSPSLSAGQWSHIRMTTPQVPNGTAPFESSSWPDDDTTVLYHKVQVGGIGSPYYAKPVDYQAVATLRSGDQIVFHNKDFHASVGGDWVRESLFPSLVGLTATNTPSDSWIQQDVEFFAYHPGHYRGKDMHGATIKGVLTVQVWRAFVVGTIPIREGSGLALPRGRIQIQRIGRDSGLTFDVTYWTLPLTLARDEAPPWYVGSPFTPIVYNPSTAEYLKVLDRKGMDYLDSSDTRITSGGDTFIGTVHERDSFGPAGDGQPQVADLTDDWLSGARMSFIDFEYVAQVDIPYELDNIDLPH